LNIFGDIVKVVADNPASILIVLGFLSILMAVFVPLDLGSQLLFGGLGFLMLIGGIIAHAVWLQR
jgi:hypothetical protein